MRGFGGSERSTLFLMQGLLEKGYNVEAISTGNICGPYLNAIPKGVIKREWSYLTEPCDIFIFYCVMENNDVKPSGKQIRLTKYATCAG